LFQLEEVYKGNLESLLYNQSASLARYT